MIRQGLVKKQAGGSRYFRNNLSDTEKKAYDAVSQGLLNHEAKIQVEGIAPNRIDYIYDVVKRDFSMLFCTDKITYQYQPLRQTGVVIPSYRFDKREIEVTIEAVNNRISNLIKRCKQCSSDWDKAKLIHDYVCKHVSYDCRGEDVKDSSYECIGPLLFGKGVCEGIAKASKYLFDLVDIECLVIHGRANENAGNTTNNESHAWIIIKVDGFYYHYDVTFDLTVMSFGYIRYDYFNLSDTDILLDHEFEQVDLPKCNRVSDYYRTSGLLMQNQRDFRRHLEKSLKRGEKDIVVKLPPVDNVKRAEAELMRIAQDLLMRRHWKIHQFQISTNPSQRVFHLHAT